MYYDLSTVAKPWELSILMNFFGVFLLIEAKKKKKIKFGLLTIDHLAF